MLVESPAEHVAGEGQRYRPLLGIGVRRPWVAYDMEEVGAGKLLQDLVRIHDKDRAVAHVYRLRSAATAVAPHVEGRLEEGLNIARPRAPSLIHIALIDLPALVI